jgi:hypothetical protein
MKHSQLKKSQDPSAHVGGGHHGVEVLTQSLEVYPPLGIGLMPA